MLTVPADFPHPGSHGYLAPDAAPVRVIQHRRDGSTLVQHLDTANRARGASLESTVPQTDLFADKREASLPQPKPARKPRRMAR